MRTFVLLAGAWHGAWCWERVTPLLAQHGHAVLAPDLLGTGDDPTPLSEVSLGRWTDQIARVVEAQPEPVVLVAHSRGGIVASMVAEHVPERVAQLVYVSGSLIPDGGSIATHGPQQDPDAPSVLQMHEDGSASMPADVARFVFLNTTDAEWAERALARLRPEPVRTFAEPLSLTPARFGSVRRAYVETLRDNGVPIDVQRAMQAALPCDPVFTLDTDHAPFYSQPEALADILLTVAARL